VLGLRSVAAYGGSGVGIALCWHHGSRLGVPQLQPDNVVQHATQAQSENGVGLGRQTRTPSRTESRMFYSRATHNNAQTRRLQICNKTTQENLFLRSFLSPRFLSNRFRSSS